MQEMIGSLVVLGFQTHLMPVGGTKDRTSSLTLEKPELLVIDLSSELLLSYFSVKDASIEKQQGKMSYFP